MLGTDSLYNGQALLQTVATLLQKGKGITKWGNLQVGQLCAITKWSWPDIRNWDNKNGLSIIKWENYYKVDQCEIKSESQL